MANITKTSKLGKELANGIVISAGELRKTILNPREIHTLVMLEDQVDALLDVLVSDKTDEQLKLTSVGRASLISEILESEETIEDANIIDTKRKFTYFSKYNSLLNQADPSDPKKYQLGHEQGIATKVLVLLQEAANEDVNNVFTAEYKKQINKALKAAEIIDKIDERTFSDIKRWADKAPNATPIGGGTMVDLETVLRSAGSVMSTDLTIEKTMKGDINNKNLTIVLRPELTGLNQFTGRLASNLLDLLRNVKKGKSTKDLDRILSNVDIFNLQGSSSIRDSLGADADKALGIKNKKVTSKYRAKVRVARKIPPNNKEAKVLKARIAKKLTTLKTKALAVKQKKKFIIPTITLKALINESLALFIKNRMGESGDPAIKLRYQTGRFSESAKLLTLNRVQAGAYLGTYGFQENPYRVFLPGGRLHTQQRDPRIYIEGAIRDIALQVLKRNFNGINLRLV